MSAATVDEVVNALVDLGKEIVDRQRYASRIKHPVMSGEQAIGLLANALLDVAKRLRDGEYGP